MHERRMTAIRVTSFVAGLLVASTGFAETSFIKGTIHAPPGQSGFTGTVIMACWAPQRECLADAPQTRSFDVTRGKASSQYYLELEEGTYWVWVYRQMNDTEAIDEGDWLDPGNEGRSLKLVHTGSTADFRMFVVGPKQPKQQKPEAEHAAMEQARPEKAKRTAPPVPKGSGGMVGIWQGVSRNLVAPGAGSAVQAGITWTPGRDWITLMSDGRAYAALPEEGLKEPFDWSQCGEKYEWCPTYTVKGNTVKVVYANGFTKTYQKKKDGDLWLGTMNYVPLAPLDGMKLDGKYVSIGNEYRTGWIHFQPDGAFTEERFLYDTSWKEIGSYRQLTPQEKKGGKGRYELRAYTLELRYSDGRVVRMSAYAFPEQLKLKTPRELYFRSWDYHLADPRR